MARLFLRVGRARPARSHVNRKQITANQANAQHSTGPKTDEGKAESCLNNFRWGFCGAFTILPSEHAEEFDTLVSGLRAEYQPQTITETILVQKMAQHHWLSQRAIHLQNVTMQDDLPLRDKERLDEPALLSEAKTQKRLDEPALLSEAKTQKMFSLFLRYQTSNDRAFHKCLNDLLRLRAERRKAEIGFERQTLQTAEHARKESAEKRKQELHSMNVFLAEAKIDHQILLNHGLEHAQKAA